MCQSQWSKAKADSSLRNLAKKRNSNIGFHRRKFCGRVEKSLCQYMCNKIFAYKTDIPKGCFLSPKATRIALALCEVGVWQSLRSFKPKLVLKIFYRYNLHCLGCSKAYQLWKEIKLNNLKLQRDSLYTVTVYHWIFSS